MPRRSDADERIRRYLTRQGLAEQDQLPPERELAANLSLSRAQVRTGLAKLKAQGILWGRVGKGTFVGKEPPLDPRNVLELSLLTNPRDIMEARLAVEPMLAALAAVRATASECAQLEKCVQKTRAAPDRATFQQWDEEFHRILARAARNPLLLALFHAVNESRKREVWGSKRNHSLSLSRRQSYISQHAACLAAILNRDPEAAASAMRDHLEFVAAACDVFGAASSFILQRDVRGSSAALPRPLRGQHFTATAA